MNLIATPWTIITIFKVLDYASLTKGVETLCNCSWLDEITFTDVTGNMRIEIFHQVLPLSSHSKSSWYCWVVCSRNSLRISKLNHRSQCVSLYGWTFWDIWINIQSSHEDTAHNSFCRVCLFIQIMLQLPWQLEVMVEVCLYVKSSLTMASFSNLDPGVRRVPGGQGGKRSPSHLLWKTAAALVLWFLLCLLPTSQHSFWYSLTHKVLFYQGF